MSVAVISTLLIAAPAARGQKPGEREVLTGAWKFSDDEGRTFKLDSLEVPPKTTVNVVARVTFGVEDLSKVGGLFFVPGKAVAKRRLTLNGKPPAGPLRGMRYAWFPMDPQKYLVKGENVFDLTGVVANKGKKPVKVNIDIRLKLLAPSLVGIQTGPMLGAIGQDYFTLALRTNMPAAVTVTAKPLEPAGGKETCARSERGFRHRLRVPLAKGTRKFAYTVTSRVGDFEKADGPVTVKAPDFEGGRLRFVAAGDCRSNPKGWGAVASKIKQADPDLVVFTGDLVTDGRWDFQWDFHFFHPAKVLLTSVPFYSAIGNHEQYAPLYFELIYSPGEDGKARNWAQAVGSVLFIGIDGNDNWRGNSPNVKWLESVLKASNEKFIFLATHYPAYSSGPHGKRGEGQMVLARKVIMPLLARYNATAMIAGHDHDYERTEPPPKQGVTCIVSGGAGAPIYGRSGTASRGNPHSKVFAAKLHFCVFDVKGDVCEMKVYEPNGNLIDERTFKAREVPAAEGEKKKAA